MRTGHTLDTFAAESSNGQSIGLDKLDIGVTLVVKTQRSSYRIVVVDRSQQLVRVHGGVFPEPTTLRLCGSTAGGSCIKVGRITVGLRMEFRVGPRRIVSSSVRSIAIEPAQDENSGYERVA
jgi:hypothetical protein